MNDRIELTSDETNSLLDMVAEASSIDLDDNPLAPFGLGLPLREIGSMVIEAAVAHVNGMRGFGTGSL